MKAVVLEAGRAHVVAEDGNIVTTPSPAYAMALPQVITHAARRASTSDAVVVYVAPSTHADHAHIIGTIRAAGWEVSDADAEQVAVSGWLTARRRLSPTVHVHVTGWRAADADPIGALWSSDDDAATIADRLGRWYATTGGRSWHTHPTTVATSWLRDIVTEGAAATNRRHGVVWRYRAPFVPPSLGFGEWKRDQAFIDLAVSIDANADRVPDAARIQSYDGNGEWLAAMSAAELPYGTLEQIGGPYPFDARLSGWWLVDTRDEVGEPHLWWEWATRSDRHPPLIRQAPNAEGRVWLSTAVMRYLDEPNSGGWELDPLDAILPARDGQGRRRSGRVLRKWAEAVSVARSAAIQAGDTVIVDALKAVYAVMLTAGLVGSRIDRMDWRAVITDTIAVGRHRRYVAGTLAGGQILATQADASWWAVQQGQAAGLDSAMGLRDRHQLGGSKRHDKPLP